MSQPSESLPSSITSPQASVAPDSVSPLSPPVSTEDTAWSGRWPACLRVAANALSFSRAAGGVALGYQIGTSDYPVDSWAPAAVALGCAATDYFDGQLARKATAIDGIKSPRGGWIDQLTDKIFVLAVIGGIACASLSSERAASGILVAVSGAVILGRDIWVTQMRLKAERANLGINTDAQMHAKIKTVVQLGAVTALSSPIAETPQGNWATASVLAGSAALAVQSGVAYRRSFSAALQAPPQAEGLKA